MMNERGVKKVPVIELKGVVNEFIVGGRAHPETEKIYAKVDEMLEDAQYDVVLIKNFVTKPPNFFPSLESRVSPSVLFASALPLCDRASDSALPSCCRRQFVVPSLLPPNPAVFPVRKGPARFFFSFFRSDFMVNGMGWVLWIRAGFYEVYEVKVSGSLV
ncbi:hypothetical protein PTKIN_Ptkin15bG0190900 [Pterospermum kingtungense]